MDDIPRALLDLLLQIAYRVYVDLGTMLSNKTVVSRDQMVRNASTYIEDEFSWLGEPYDWSLWTWAFLGLDRGGKRLRTGGRRWDRWAGDGTGCILRMLMYMNRWM